MATNTACSQNNKDMLVGKWRFADDFECPDFLQLNTDGKYVIFNDCGCQNPELPIIEKGSWSLKENEITLYNRKFVSKNSVFVEYHGSESELYFKVKEVSADKLILCFVDNKSDCKIEKYIRIDNYIEIHKAYSGVSQVIEEIAISKRKYTTITLSYDFYREPDQLIVEDQQGNILFKTEMTGTERKQVKEIDLSNNRNIEKLFFKINTGKTTSKWKFNVEIK